MSCLTFVTKNFPFHLHVASPSTPELSADELPDDITNEMADIPNDLELNQEDFSDVLPRLPDDLQDFDLFEGCHTALSHISCCVGLCCVRLSVHTFTLSFIQKKYHICWLFHPDVNALLFYSI